MTPVEISDFDSHGVSLTAATAADFDTRAQAILGDHASRLDDLKPYLAIVRNRNPRTVVAYTVAWSATRRNDSSETTHSEFKFPDAVAGTANGLAMLRGREMQTGEERVVGLGFEVWPAEYADAFCEFGRQAAFGLGEVKRLHVALDAVIFEDGALLGPNESRLAEHFIEFVHAKQALYRDIVVGLENGEVLDDPFAPLRETLAARHPTAHNAMDYRRKAAAEILGFQQRVALEVFRRTLRREPFAIRRPSGT